MRHSETSARPIWDACWILFSLVHACACGKISQSTAPALQFLMYSTSVPTQSKLLFQLAVKKQYQLNSAGRREGVGVCCRSLKLISNLWNIPSYPKRKSLAGGVFSVERSRENIWIYEISGTFHIFQLHGLFHIILADKFGKIFLWNQIETLWASILMSCNSPNSIAAKWRALYERWNAKYLTLVRQHVNHVIISLYRK